MTDTQGNLSLVDIPFGRVLRYILDEDRFLSVAEWDGEPNGLAITEDGFLIVADCKQGIVSFVV